MSDEWPTQDVENDPWAVNETQAEPEFKDASVKSPPNGKKTPLKDKKAAGEKKVPRERKPLGRKSNAASKKPENTDGSSAEQPNQLEGTGNEETGDGWGALAPDEIDPWDTPGGDAEKANETEDAWGVPTPGEYDPWDISESQPDAGDTAVKPPGAKKPQRDKKPGDKKRQPKERKSHGEKKSTWDDTTETPGTPFSETQTSPAEGDDRKKTFAYNNPERVRTGGAQRDKLTEDELTERMARMREQNEKIKQRRMDVVADEESFKKTQESERIKQEKNRKEQESVNRTREQNARRKMDKIRSREWDSGKSTGEWQQARKTQEESGGPLQGGGSPRGRGGGGRGGPSWRGKGRGGDMGDGEPPDPTPTAKTEDATSPNPEASAVTEGI